MTILESNYIEISHFLKLMDEVQEQTLSLFGQQLEVQQKADSSPLSKADTINHDLLSKALPLLRGIPVFSEEAYPSYFERQKYSEYWLIDPVDGTKEFIHGVPEFSVLVALVRDSRPRFAAILVPARRTIYLAEEGRGAFRVSDGVWTSLRDRVSHSRKGLVSRYHPEPEVEDFYDNHGVVESVGLGSALKFCALADGEASIYFRHKGPHEWDVAAGDLLVHEAGGKMFSWPTREPIRYNGELSRVSSFLALGVQVVL